MQKKGSVVLTEVVRMAVFSEYNFLVTGHTHRECDVDHAMIERQKKKKRKHRYSYTTPTTGFN